MHPATHSARDIALTGVSGSTTLSDARITPASRRARHARRAVNLARLSSLAAALSCTLPAMAQAPGGNGQPSTTWSVGAGVISAQKPYTDISRDNKVLPLVQFENQYIEIFGPKIGLKLPSFNINASNQLNFNLVAKYDGSGYEAKDAAILNGMRERKGGFWGGAEVEWKNDLADVKAAWLGDLSGNSKGQQFSLGVERTWKVGGKLMLTPRAGAIWQDDKYVDYYFGVRDSEARVGRAAYTGKSGTTAEVGLRAIYMIDQRHSLFADLAMSSLPKSIKNSSLVDSSTENRVMLGYTYRFQ
ncbi:MipA/OmpV family protein [Pigmentiphaga aceris]|uniref:MipA/OmpV family protein n=1 Tax=Pigmentiphaga aceris TaxID=1940612 RepID=A0A5C0B154_9BURK|nr:MipA/OmpV family protein [Pigmentiphaga aceris]QEI06387.1 MipA/OmpV family protein [Pigmentiphaga aceris]